MVSLTIVLSACDKNEIVADAKLVKCLNHSYVYYLLFYYSKDPLHHSKLLIGMRSILWTSQFVFVTLNVLVINNRCLIFPKNSYDGRRRFRKRLARFSRQLYHYLDIRKKKI